MDRLFTLLAVSRAMPVAVRYGVTTALVLAFFAMHKMVPNDPSHPNFLLLVPAVIIAGVLFNRGTGIFATLFGGLLSGILVVEPVSKLQFQTDAQLFAVVQFVCVGFFAAIVLEALHVALERLAEEHRRLAEANKRLSGVAEQKGTLLSESVHRSRNDLQRLAATIRLQEGTFRDESVRDALRTTANRIMALARINYRLDAHRDDGLSIVDSQGFLGGLVEDIADGFRGIRPVAMDVRVESHPLSMARAVPIGLLVNELVGNALKYAFPDEIEGRITVTFRRDGDAFVIVVEDDGVGFDPAAPPKGSGIGMKISRALAGQLGGRLDVKPREAGGNRPGVRWIGTIPVDGQV